MPFVIEEKRGFGRKKKLYADTEYKVDSYIHAQALKHPNWKWKVTYKKRGLLRRMILLERLGEKQI